MTKLTIRNALLLPAIIIFGASAFAQAFSPNDIIGTWERGNLRLVFENDHTMQFCTSGVPISLTANGTILTINSVSTFTRLSGSGTDNLVGNWRDAPNGEEIYYRADGRSLSLFDGEKATYSGTFSTDFTTSPPTISGCELRAGFSVAGTTLTQWNFDNGIQSTTISIEPQTSITFDVTGTPQVWNWVP